VSLTDGLAIVSLFAKVDTGAEFCFFERGFAEALGIEVENGTPLDCATLTDRFRSYGHELTLVALGVEVSSTVYFYENPAIRRNVLGRNGWLNRVRLGLVDYDARVYVSDYND
jgi:hypothetical protein